MSYIKFDKLQLINLEYSLNKELLRSNRGGAYSSTTIIGCNTRKYHGLLITRQPAIDNGHHVLLSAIDETIIQQGTAFNLGIRKYQGGNYNPKGHKYVRDFDTEPIPKLTFRVGGVVLDKESLFTHNDDRIIVRYTLVEANSPTTLRLKPFLAFRSFHQLTKENVFADTKYQPVKNGIRVKMYEGYSPLFIQISKSDEYVHVPHWYHNIEYQEEMERGYEYLEDLFVPGFFELPIKKGESIYVSAGLNEVEPDALARLFEDEVERRTPRDNFIHCLINSAHQFIVSRDKVTEVIAGFPWFGTRGRDSFIALPGLTLIDDRKTNFKEVIATMVKRMQGDSFPNYPDEEYSGSMTADNQLWFFWTLQQYAEHTGEKSWVWKNYGALMKCILNAYRSGAYENIRMQEDGLIYAASEGKPLTWMDAIVDGMPVTLRSGMPVEVNALWYNAILFSVELAQKAGEKDFAADWKALAEKIRVSFNATYWDEEKAYLADCVDGKIKDWAVRPNQVIAASLTYTPLDEEKRKKLLDKVRSELLTTRGLRSLSPKDPNYKGIYFGNQTVRDLAAHQGSVYPWLLAHFSEAWLKIHGNSGVSIIKSIFEGFEPAIKENGIGTVSECYDGDPPHYAGGAISMAGSVGELLRMGMLIEKYQ